MGLSEFEDFRPKPGTHCLFTRAWHPQHSGSHKFARLRIFRVEARRRPVGFIQHQQVYVDETYSSANPDGWRVTYRNVPRWVWTPISTDASIGGDHYEDMDDAIEALVSRKEFVERARKG